MNKIKILLISLCLFSCQFSGGEVAINESEKCSDTLLEGFHGECYTIFFDYYLDSQKIGRIRVKDSLAGILPEEFLKTKIPVPKVKIEERHLKKVSIDDSDTAILDMLITVFDLANIIKTSSYEANVNNNVSVFDLFEEPITISFKKQSRILEYSGRKFKILPEKLKIISNIKLKDFNNCFEHFSEVQEGKLSKVKFVFGDNIFKFDIIPMHNENNLYLWEQLQF